MESIGVLLTYSLLIPAAGGSTDNYGRKGQFCPALEIVGGRPLILSILDEYVGSEVSDIRIGVRPEDVFAVHETLAPHKLMSLISVIPIEKSDGPLDTLRMLVSEGGDLAQSSLVNLGDTLIANPMDLTNFDLAAAISPVEDSERWAVVELDSLHQIMSVVNKQILSDGKGSRTFSAEDTPIALVGVYWWRDSQHLVSKLDVATEISDLLISSGVDCRAVAAMNWIDSDHLDNLSQAKAKLFSSRAFNTLSLDLSIGVITKSSFHKREKILAEIAYFKQLPAHQSQLFPRLLSVNEIDGSYSLEFLPYPNLSEIFVYRDAPFRTWRRIIDKLLDSFLPRLHLPPEEFADQGPSMPLGDSLNRYLLEKGNARAKEVLASDAIFECLKDDNPVINGDELLGVHQVLELAANWISGYDASVSVIHGDLCMSNILYEPEFEIFRLIDPRGGLEEPSLFGPVTYDFAKLAHSFVGMYDLILNDRFTLGLSDSTSSREVNYSLFETNRQREISGYFQERMLARGFARHDLQLLSSVLLLSLVPLHIENPNRANAFLSQALILASRAAKKV